MVTGKISYFNSTKGFGFIKRDDDLPDVFVHVSQFEGEVAPPLGTPLEFVVEQDRAGRYRAADVRLTREPAREPVRP